MRLLPAFVFYVMGCCVTLLYNLIFWRLLNTTDVNVGI